MRNLFLSLVLANLLTLAWQFWVDPSPPMAFNKAGDGLALFGPRSAPAQATVPARPSPADVDGPPPAPPAGVCFRLGPLPDSAAAQQAAGSLAGRGIDATPFARDAQLWLGHWVQISGFESVAAAENARERLVAGGIADALVMQDGPRPMISLGVFRDRGRADRIAGAARNLGFEVGMRDRYRPGVEQWLLVRPRTGQEIRPADLSLAGDRIMRAETTPCEDAGSVAAPAEAGPVGPDAGVPVPSGAEQPL
jgi:hypothetical protein